MHFKARHTPNSLPTHTTVSRKLLQDGGQGGPDETPEAFMANRQVARQTEILQKAAMQAEADTLNTVLQHKSLEQRFADINSARKMLQVKGHGGPGSASEAFPASRQTNSQRETQQFSLNTVQARGKRFVDWHANSPVVGKRNLLQDGGHAGPDSMPERFAANWQTEFQREVQRKGVNAVQARSEQLFAD